MPHDPLVRLLTDRLLAAQDVLSRRSGWTRGLLAPRIPPDTVREVSAALVPVIRQAVSEALVENAARPIHVHHADPLRWTHPVFQEPAAPNDSPTGAGERPVGSQAGAVVSGDDGPGPAADRDA